VIKRIRLLIMTFANADIIGTNMRMGSANVECQMTIVLAYIPVLALYCHKKWGLQLCGIVQSASDFISMPALHTEKVNTCYEGILTRVNFSDSKKNGV
jgi:hypothetical protein